MPNGEYGRVPTKILRFARRFAARYGWRAYALPILTVLTIWVLWPTISPAAQGSGRASGTAARGGVSTGAAAAQGPAQVGARVTGAQAASPTPLPTSVCAGNSAGPLVLVSVTYQHVWMCEGATQVYDTPATTGATGGDDATPIGTWQIQSRETERYLDGPGYRDYVHFWLPFDGDFGFHDATWQTIPFGSSDYPSAASHGCVHLPLDAAQWLYNWSVVGVTTVTVQA